MQELIELITNEIDRNTALMDASVDKQYYRVKIEAFNEALDMVRMVWK